MMPYLKQTCSRILPILLGVLLVATPSCQPSAVTPDAVTEFMEAAWDHTPSEENAELIAAEVRAELERRQKEAELMAYYEAVDAELKRREAEAAASAYPAGTTASGWAALRKCESGGNYSIVSASGTYMGAYQFDQQTWNNNAPSGYVGVRPHHAPSHIQDRAAFTLYERRGSSPWPHCGKYL